MLFIIPLLNIPNGGNSISYYFLFTVSFIQLHLFRGHLSH